MSNINKNRDDEVAMGFNAVKRGNNARSDFGNHHIDMSKNNN